MPSYRLQITAQTSDGNQCHQDMRFDAATDDQAAATVARWSEVFRRHGAAATFTLTKDQEATAMQKQDHSGRTVLAQIDAARRRTIAAEIEARLAAIEEAKRSLLTAIIGRPTPGAPKIDGRNVLDWISKLPREHQQPMTDIATQALNVYQELKRLDDAADRLRRQVREMLA